MALPQENMLKLMNWLNDDEVKAQYAEAPGIIEELGRLVFQGELEWPNYVDNAATYASTISEWLTDQEDYTEFETLTGSSAQSLAGFIRFIEPVIDKWQTAAAKEEGGAVGLANPNYSTDPTPGTQFYWYDESAGTYLYSDTADGDDWKTYEERRYIDPNGTKDDSYGGLFYRYDKRDEIYQWYDDENGIWESQEWADQFVVAKRAEAEKAAKAAAIEGQAPPAAAEAAGAEAQAPSAFWDENWQMFYRIGPSGAYEYADAIDPGSESSGCSEKWLSYEQVMTRPEPVTAPPPAPPAEPPAAPPQPAVAEAAESLAEDMLAAVSQVFEDEPGLEQLLSDADIQGIFEELVNELPE
jgi:hypothetical protein